LHQLLPATTSVAFLTNPTNPDFAEAEKREVQRAAQAFAIDLQVLDASTGAEIESAFKALLTQRAGALVVSGEFITQRDQLAALAIQGGVPMMCQNREQVAAGSLMSYGTSLPDAYRIMGAYTGRILKGEKPAVLPVQRGTKIELFLNLKTAMSLGLTFPIGLLGRADEVIE
jgi:putative ABC transport system substrate-binding protein